MITNLNTISRFILCQFIVGFLTLAVHTSLLAQAPSWETVAQQKHDHEKQSMQILMAWGGISVLSGSAMAFSSKSRDFGLMTAGWGAVNALIAGIALASVGDLPVDWSDALRDEQLLNRILAINTGLDIGYIGVGTTMALAGKGRTRSFGNAIIVQGAFLLAFDVVLLKQSTQRLEGLSVEPTLIHTRFESNYSKPGLTLRLQL